MTEAMRLVGAGPPASTIRDSSAAIWVRDAMKLRASYASTMNTTGAATRSRTATSWRDSTRSPVWRMAGTPSGRSTGLPNATAALWRTTRAVHQPARRRRPATPSPCRLTAAAELAADPASGRT